MAVFGLFFAFPAQAAQAQDLPVAQIMIQSHRDAVNIEAGKAFTFQVGFKNVGTGEWVDSGPKGVGLRSPGPSPFYHSYWVNITEPTKMDIPSAKPGEIGFFKFSMQAPQEPGAYVAEFQLVQGAALWIRNGSIKIPINVLALRSSAEGGVKKGLLQEEPDIRVGLFETTDPVIISSESSYEVKNLSGSTLFSATAGQLTTILFDPTTKAYTIDVAGQKKTASQGLRLESSSTTPVFEIESYKNRPAWNPAINDNTFWGVIEMKYDAEQDESWVINELPMEKYLEGLAESSNSSPAEFQQALAIAARTYASYHYLNPSKHDMFTVDAQYDQVYRGYNLSLRLDKWVEGVQASGGKVVTLDDEIVITPYFSQSDGRTRTWTEVWGGGHKSWLVSVPDPWNEGKEKLGHGVGMSAQGAIGLAQEDGYNYQEILTHYYTGVDIQKAY